MLTVTGNHTVDISDIDTHYKHLLTFIKQENVRNL